MMNNNSPIDRLDQHYAGHLGCCTDDLTSGRVVVVPNKGIDNIRFARAVPLAVYGLSKAGGIVLSVLPSLVDATRQCLEGQQCTALDDDVCNVLQQELEPLIHARMWFRGRRLYCSAETFVDCSFGDVREVTQDDEVAAALNIKWGGPVFGQIVDCRTVSWAAVKPLSDIAWDLSIETLPDYRGKGYAKSAVSRAVRHILNRGRLATWGCDRDNAASLRTAKALGFQDYALDFGCVEFPS